MFYSHEVLTSRKHGVATVWLVATLGSKSTLKKVDRKEICAVNIPKACQTIVSPEAPMALRLQSNLLYGVTRVYGEQCNFVLKDAQAEQNKIRTLLRSLHAPPIELDGKHKAKPTQLVLEDDPNFIPELAWGIDFDPFHDVLGFTSGEGSSQRSSLLSPHVAFSSALGSEHMDPNLNLVIPPSSSAGGGGFDLGLGGGSVGGSDHNRGYSRSLFGANEEGLLPELDLGLGLDFDVDGNMVDNAAVPSGGRAASVHTPAPVVRDGGLPDSNADGDVVMYDDDPLPTYQDDVDMQDVEPFAPRATAQQADTDDPAASQGQEAQSQTSSTTASAPAARTRVPKPLPQDQELELHNSDLQSWDREYLDNQLRATQHKLQNKSLVLARKNAEFWVLQNGIGGLGAVYQGAEQHMPEPLRMFSGNALLEALTGIRLTIAGTKHPRDIDSNPEDQERRVRSRSDDEVGRAADANDAAAFDTGFFDDTIVHTIEQGREAPTPLQDQHSSAHALPWNYAAPPSRGSSHTAFIPPFPIFAPTANPSSSIAGGGGFIAASSARGRRTVTASPLVGRGTIPTTTRPEDLNFMQDDLDDNQAHPSQHPSFPLFGPAAAVSTQLANSPAFASSTLSTESLNFLAFVKAAISQRKEALETTIEAIASVLDVQDSGADEKVAAIMFEELLVPEENSVVVAAQGFLHVLTLVGRGFLGAEQEGPFQGIELRVL
ncbi:hypothetical protein E4T48_07900 [Aureobasidium sp. EXF-10727]|nr:hypothetical protein E4T48_07900 [Aureobasidium sp. EXF-10727]